jgi:small-conductance mechanosensitive channel
MLAMLMSLGGDRPFVGRYALACLVAVLMLWAWLPIAVQATEEKAGEPSAAAAPWETADVIVDGRVILTVRGVSSLPAARRAAEIRERIILTAGDDTLSTDAISLQEGEDRTSIMAGERRLLYLLDVDAEIEGIERAILAEAVQRRIRDVITSYRLERTPRALVTKTLYAIVATVIAAGLFFALRKGSRRLDGLVLQRLQKRLQALEAQSASFLKAQQLAKLLRRLIKVLSVVLLALTLYFYLQFVLGLYPWTRYFATWLFDLIAEPLRTMGEAVLASIPDLVFLVILFYIVRYVLRMIQAFFAGIDNGVIKLASFQQEWAWPTFRIVRLLVLIFAVVVAYPYIPGSASDAFKGISILLGLIISIGSSSIIGNIIAGYSLAYRRPFRIGDRVRINDVIGDVLETRVLVTRPRSIKNEEIVIPNTKILDGEVVNYNTFADQRGLILHTTVGIGYETPWRQVEAMLKLAADRTPGLLKKPAPFVRQKALGDFAVTYEINAYCSEPRHMEQLYSALHRNILDAFNEYGVAIMTPAYERDPEQPKVVPKEQWYAAPATPAEGSARPEVRTTDAE